MLVPFFRLVPLWISVQYRYLAFSRTGIPEPVSRDNGPVPVKLTRIDDGGLLDDEKEHLQLPPGHGWMLTNTGLSEGSTIGHGTPMAPCKMPGQPMCDVTGNTTFRMTMRMRTPIVSHRDAGGFFKRGCPRLQREARECGSRRQAIVSEGR